VGDEDPLFNDDWDAATPLYPETSPALPPITLLVAAVGGNLMFDPSKEELAVADAIIAVALANSEDSVKAGGGLRLLTVRTIDPLARLTTPGVPDTQNSAVLGAEEKPSTKAAALNESEEGVWRPPQGGMKRSLITRAVAACVGGVAAELLQSLKDFRQKS
jgi:exosome complex component RRP42